MGAQCGRCPPRRALLLLRGRGLLLNARNAALPAALLLGAAALLRLAAGVPLAFEDSYHHWLIAATLAAGGGLHDPLFAMEDAWLPGYHVVAATLLWAVGLHSIDSLRALSGVLAIITIGLVYHLADGGRRGALAGALLALNPVFLLTATSVVAEPLLTALLLGATAAALARRYPLAALLAAAAVLTGTKAWIWLVALAALHLLTSRQAASRPPAVVVWAVPSLALLLLMEVVLDPAGHSVARASVEVSAAGARGSLPLTPLGRGWELITTFGLAGLPLFALAPIGLLAERRAAGGPARVLLLHLPALIYLGTVVLLVFVGVFSGSHRYLYPALPALALLAGSALARVPSLASVLALVGAGLLATGFIPVLQGMGNLDSGLATAGRAAATRSGVLLTDSPVAAYWSGRRPDAITGSRALPDRDVAGWLQSRGIGVVIVENVAYYREHSVLRGLDQGVPQAGLVPLGDQAAYNPGAGAKPVFAYWLPPAKYRIAATGGIAVASEPGVVGTTGKTRGLALGARIEVNGAAIAGEGLGFGVPIVRFPDGDYFSGSATTEPIPSGWRITYLLDRVGMSADRAFVESPSRGSVVVTYLAAPGGLSVMVRPVSLQVGYREVVILNEQSSAFDDYADSSGSRLGPAIGSWSPVAGGWGRLRSGSLGVEWSQPALPGARGFYAAREQRTPDIDFSGLEYVFGPDFTGADYTITVGPAR